MPEYKSHGLEWERGELLAQAKESCCHCRGYGLTKGRGDGRVCNCVLRNIFREVYHRYRTALFIQENSNSRVSRLRSIIFFRKNEEFVADLACTASKFLSEHEFKVFHHHFMMGDDWKSCCAFLKMNRGDFFHAVYRIQQKMGVIYKQEGMWPTRGYFGGVIRSSVTARRLITGFKGEPVRAPIKGDKKDEMLTVATGVRKRGPLHPANYRGPDHDGVGQLAPSGQSSDLALSAV